ncbi:MAG: hypothetical protein R6V21_06040 [Pelovirga sp.]
MNNSLTPISADQHELEPHCFTTTGVIAFDGDGYSANRGYIDAEIVSNEYPDLPYVTANPACQAYSDPQSRIVNGNHIDVYA